MKYLFFSYLLLCITISCKKLRPNSELINPEYDRAYSFDSLSIHDSAYIYYGKALENFKQQKDNFGEAKCLLGMAKILDVKGNYFKAQDFSLKAKTLFNVNDRNQFYHISDNFNNLGDISNNLKKYKEAKDYYKSAIKYAEREDVKIIFIANIAKIYKEEKKYSQAIKIYDSILPIAKKTDTLTYARVLSNLAYIKWLNDNSYNLEPLQTQALEIQKNIDDKMGQNASYSHLADYFKSKNLKKALQYAKNMYQVAKDVNSSDDQIESLQKITALDSKNYLKKFNQYTSLRDSVQNARNTDNDKFATIVYGVEEKNAQNQILKTESLKKTIGIVFLVLILIGGIFYYKKRKKRLQQEKELEVKNTELRYSKKVHDVVANGIYQVMTKIENQENFNKDEALDELEFVYEKSRDISYEKEDSKNSEEEFKEKISNLIASFKNSSVETYIAGNENKIWSNISSSTGEEVYQIIRELLVNMKKHSKADRVVFKFERINNFIKIQYSDNGIGISGDLIYKNGLSSTVSRMEKINGEITFDIKTEKGLKINISFPAS